VDSLILEDNSCISQSLGHLEVNYLRL